MLVHSPSHATATLVAHVVQSEINRLSNVLDHRRDDTEISDLLRVRAAIVSSDLFSVLLLSEAWRCISRGAFDSRMGGLLRLWSSEAPPDLLSIEGALAATRNSTVTLDPATRWIALSADVALSLDGLAKGYIIDAAMDAARRAVPTLEGMLINIGGDIRCFGQAPTRHGWGIGIPDPSIPAENAPIVDAVYLSNSAVATSGRGPRDRTRAGYRSTTISPFSGYPVKNVISATVVASHTADADAIATACMVLHPKESVALVDKLDGVGARITETGGRVWLSNRWPALRLVATDTVERGGAAQGIANRSEDKKRPLPPEIRWPSYWELAISYSASDYSSDAHDPYIAVWITDTDGRPVTTLLLLGSDPRWARENFIWWDSWSHRAKREIYTHSRPTTRSGQYDMEWLGVDEDLNPVPIGKYILHFETSREHGKHTYRAIPIEIDRERFTMTLRDIDGMGSLDIAYKPYVERPPTDH